jgi:NAD(P)-dependent dehydrogenase (short-subunit alcohol dehydrogenase family)
MVPSCCTPQSPDTPNASRPSPDPRRDGPTLASDHVAKQIPKGGPPDDRPSVGARDRRIERYGFSIRRVARCRRLRPGHRRGRSGDFLRGRQSEKPRPFGASIQADLRTEIGIQNTSDAITSDSRPLSVAVLNAGIGRGGTFVDTPLQDTLAVIDTNVRAIHLTKIVLEEMPTHGHGRIRFTSSVASLTSGPYQTALQSFQIVRAVVCSSTAKRVARQRNHSDITDARPDSDQFLSSGTYGRHRNGAIEKILPRSPARATRH